MYLTRIFIFLSLMTLLACSSLNTNQGDDALEAIPTDFTGLDRDLYPEFLRLSNLSNCQLPCWWGLEIGASTLGEVLQFLQETNFNRFQERRTDNEMSPETYIRLEGYSLDFTGQGSGEIGDIDFHFSFNENHILTGISLTLRQPNLWIPDNQNPFIVSHVFERLDIIPSIFTSAPEYTTRSDYPIFIVYPESKFQLWYTFDFSDYPEICPSSENMKSIDLTLSIYPENFVSADSVIIPLEMSLLEGVTAAEFVQFVRENPNECLNLSEDN